MLGLGLMAINQCGLGCPLGFLSCYSLMSEDLTAFLSHCSGDGYCDVGPFRKVVQVKNGGTPSVQRNGENFFLRINPALTWN